METSLSDLLLDHTYALPAELFWENGSDSCINSAPETYYTCTGTQTDSFYPLNSKLLDTIFSQVDLCLNPGPTRAHVLNECEGHSDITVTANHKIRCRLSTLLNLLQRLPPSPFLSSAPPVSPLDEPFSENTPPQGTPVHINLVKRDSSPPRKICHSSNLSLSSQPMHTCSLCSNTFTRKFALTEHVRIVHERNPPHLCPHCGHGFKRPALLRDHIRSKHTKTRRFYCPLCFKGFIRRPDFVRHHSRHHQKSPSGSIQ